MSDLILFLVGCVVSLMVAGAVGLLLWGAASEPRGSVFSRGKAVTPGRRMSRGSPAVREGRNGREARSLVG